MSEDARNSWFGRLNSGLSRSSNKLTFGITDIFTKRTLDAEAVEELEEVLIAGDLGVAMAGRLAQDIAAMRFDKDAGSEKVRSALAEIICEILEPVAIPLVIDSALKPHVILVCGANGSGKTTTIGKLAKQLKGDGKQVLIAACDTFRAAAVEQLKIWGERSGCSVVEGADGGDPAGLAFDA